MTIPTVRGKLHFTMILMLVTISSSTFALDPDRLGQEEDIREAVFRHQFDRNASGQQKTAHAYCLSIMVGGKDLDPPVEFIKRFAHHKPPVRKWSACHWTSIPVVGNLFGRSALIFSCFED
jgi:hypothetical protein